MSAIRVVVADDDEIMRRAMVDVLTSHGGFQVVADVATGVALAEVVTEQPAKHVVRRVGEPAQADQEALSVLTTGGITPDATVLTQLEGDRVLVKADGSDAVSLPRDVAMHVFVDSQ